MNVMDLKYALTARACSPELADEICAKLARLEEIERQEPVAVFKGAHDGRFVIDWLHGYIPPVNLALYAAPVPPAAEQPNRVMLVGPRAAAIERTAALASRVAGDETAAAIRKSGVVMLDNECPHCKRY